MSDDFQRRYPLARARLVHGSVLAAFLIVLALRFGNLRQPGRYRRALERSFPARPFLCGPDSSLPQLPPAGDRLIIDRRGVWYAEWNHAPVPWTQIADVFQRGGRVQSHLAIQLRDADAFAASLPEAEGRRVMTGRLAKNGLLLIPNNAVEATLGDIAQAIQEGQRQYLP